jgi:hypothetical protein
MAEQPPHGQYNMKDNRKQARKLLMSYTPVFDLYGGGRLGYLADITLLGAMVIGDKPIAEESAITLQIEVPDLEDIKVKRLTIPARAVWCQPDISPDFFNIGFEFKDVKPEHEKVIQAIIDTYEFQRKLPDYPFRASTKQP